MITFQGCNAAIPNANKNIEDKYGVDSVIIEIKNLSTIRVIQIEIIN